MKGYTRSTTIYQIYDNHDDANTNDDNDDDPDDEVVNCDGNITTNIRNHHMSPNQEELCQ